MAALGIARYGGISYNERYELLCRRLMLERLYKATCYIRATNASPTRIVQPAEDLAFGRFAAALRAHAFLFRQNQSS